ncbi:MAG: DNA-directed RNA polymerase subunit alpha [Candidatus Moranbacteria bacterium GW2011_GWC2_37_8]|nr:MAG: DNA-directed RNA polymerase subunit alpha [Candidatus Moranbacteria bacterium GW2011_GWC2_37_8]KKQ62915.1 MAG: DNA-directed RNA polymerase subunit alpha, DNA-directed RNA polymerase subunit alpha [Parcubacteria group bacterium GW2011_GWC1_38_22]KKQ81238.1 MAG: DNA-directed RNA polymerase subunit alpha [Candidatus Moranbacteria bacterium GW2011_GWD2_38_7]
MQTVSLPQKPKYTPIDEKSGKFEIMGCYPGYGMTLGNALRRVLLASLKGSAITSVKIKGVSHEFSTMDGVMEDAVQIILNLKKIRFKMHSDEPVKVSLKFKGEGKVTAAEIKCPSSVEVVNKDQIIATITDKKVELEMELEISNGLGYVPIDQQNRGEKEIGVIAIDAVYTPISRVNYEVENMRVGKRTDYNKITLEIVTDGSITPEEAFTKAVTLLVEQFSVLGGIEIVEEKVEEAVQEAEIVAETPVADEAVDPLKIKVTELKNLSTRTLNVLEASKIAKVKDIVKMTEEDLRALDGMGDKGIKEIKKSIGEFGITLKQE